MKITMRIGALLLAATLAAACGGGSEPSQSEDDSGSTAAGGNGSGSNSDGSQDGQGGKKKNKHDKHDGSGNGGGKKDETGKVPEGAIVVEVKGGKVSGAEDTVDITLGDEVVLVVSSDMADEVHVHGYDETDDVSPTEDAKIKFTADIPGVFEVELEEAARLLFELQVQ